MRTLRSINKKILAFAFLIMMIGGSFIYYNLQKDHKPKFISKSDFYGDNYYITLNARAEIIKTDRWRFHIINNLTNLSEDTINILWQWGNLIEVKYVDGSIESIDISNNHTDSYQLKIKESIGYIIELTEYGFDKKPSDMWMEWKIKIKEIPYIFNISYHLSVSDETITRSYKV